MFCADKRADPQTWIPAQLVGMVDRPLQHLHRPERAADRGRKPLDAECASSLRCTFTVGDGEDREAEAVGPPGRRVGRRSGPVVPRQPPRPPCRLSLPDLLRRRPREGASSTAGVSRHRASCGRDRRLARGDAGVAVDNEPSPTTGRRDPGLRVGPPVRAEHRLEPSLAHTSIMADEHFAGGDSYETGARPTWLAVVLLAHLTYVSERSLEEKFGRQLREGARASRLRMEFARWRATSTTRRALAPGRLRRELLSLPEQGHGLLSIRSRTPTARARLQARPSTARSSCPSTPTGAFRPVTRWRSPACSSPPVRRSRDARGGVAVRSRFVLLRVPEYPARPCGDFSRTCSRASRAPTLCSPLCPSVPPNTSTRLRPRRLARYMAASRPCGDLSSAASVPGSALYATPILAESGRQARDREGARQSVP